jgi:murein DD-endopeptidase MepM/ murein hydrolase activator NlpD
MAIALPLRSTSTQPRSYWLSQPYHASGTSYNPSPHLALDMIGYGGQPVYAADSGRVFAASWNGDGWAIGGGYTVIIDHFGQGKRYGKTGYAHMSRLAVADNQYVMRGQLIGYAGTTGNSTGAHVHFSLGEAAGPPSLYNSWRWQNPYRYMRAHTYANGAAGNGDRIGSYHVGRNTFAVNQGVNIRTGRYLSSPIIRNTSVVTSTAYLNEAAGSGYGGSTLWFQVYDPGSRRVGWVHSTLGRWVT